MWHRSLVNYDYPIANVMIHNSSIPMCKRYTIVHSPWETHPDDQDQSSLKLGSSAL